MLLFCFYSCRNLNNFYKLLIIVVIRNKNKQIDNIRNIMHFYQKFYHFFSSTENTETVKEFEFERFYLDDHLLEIRERQQLGFVTLNGNLAVSLKPTHPRLLNGKGQFTFLKTKSLHPSGIVVTHQKLNFLEINSFW